MQRIGIYGGTFNPPHLGHFRAAQYAREALGLDRLLLIPDRVSPHKQLPPGSPDYAQRMQMLRLGLESQDQAAITLTSIEHSQCDYMFETVLQVRSQYPKAKLYLILGSDMLPGLSQWHQSDTILQYADLAVLYRDNGQEDRSVDAAKRELEAMGARITLVGNPVTAISSTQLRRMLVFRCASEYLPEAVERYIYENGFYGTGEDYRNLPEEALRQAVVNLLKPNRVKHVLGCAETAGELARLYGVNEIDAVRAALLHDITKALDGPLQLTLCRAYGTMLDTFSAQNPKTLHALTGSLVAERIFGENEAVVSAIRSHTTGKADMNLLEKIIYVADYMEPNRDFPGVERLRSLAYEDITQALKLGLEMTLDMLKQQGREISPESREALRYLSTGG